MALPNAAVILGAGWSIPAGLPSAADLFAGELQVASATAYQHVSVVQAAYERWAERQAEPKAELFLRECYENNLYPAPWPYVVEYVQARLATPVWPDRRSFSSLRYGQRITNRTYCWPHEEFWLGLRKRVILSGVATTNYDLLAERSLRHRQMKRPPLPGFHYAGLPKPIVALGQAEPWTVHDRRSHVLLTGLIPLAKLHGSLNWTVSGGKSLTVYQDTRAAFRQGGTVAIVPPIPEKVPPAWLSPVWTAARDLLARSSIWIVVGYSLPEYDHAIRGLLTSAAGRNLSHIELHDPYAAQLERQWNSLLPSVKVLCCPGIA